MIIGQSVTQKLREKIFEIIANSISGSLTSSVGVSVKFTIWDSIRALTYVSVSNSIYVLVCVSVLLTMRKKIML